MRRSPIAAIVLLFVLLTAATVRAESSLPPREAWVPDDALLVIDVHNPRPLLDLLTAESSLDFVRSSPAYQRKAKDFQQLFTVVKFLEGRFNTPWREGLHKLLGGGFTLAIEPGGNVLLMVDSSDPKLLKQLNDIVVGFAQGDSKRKDKVASDEYHGVTGWKLNPKEAHALVDGRLVLCNSVAGLKAVIDRRSEPGKDCLAKLPGYIAARETARDAVATLYVNMAAINQAPWFQERLKLGGNPLGVLLLAGLTEVARQSNWLALAADVQGDTLTLRLASDGKAATSGAGAFSIPKDDKSGAMPELKVGRSIASVSLYRDMHGFYAAKDELFPERTSGLIFFENMMGIFFTGRDLTEEVMAELDSDVRVVVARQEYDPKIGTPAVKVPGFAAVFHLKRPERFARVAEEAWQKALGLVNFTRGQNAQPGLIIDRSVHDGVKYTVAYFADPEESDRSAIDIRFNYRPSLATAHGYLILSSTDALAEELIDALGKQSKEGRSPLGGTHSLLQLDGTQLSEVLQSNREAMVRQNMVKEGHTREEAEAGVDTLLLVLNLVKSARLEAGIGPSQQARATLQVKLNLPQ